MSNQHKALGRGIGALIPGAAPASSPAPVAESGPTRIPLESIEPAVLSDGVAPEGNIDE